MIEIPDSLRSVYSGRIQELDGEYVLEVPKEEIERGAISSGAPHRVVLFEPIEMPPDETDDGTPTGTTEDRNPGPPVSKGDIRDVIIKDTGDEGDGIATVERGFVVIVPGASPGDEPTVEIKKVSRSVAFANIVQDG